MECHVCRFFDPSKNPGHTAGHSKTPTFGLVPGAGEF